MSRKFLQGHHPVLIDISFVGHQLPGYPVKIGDHQIAACLFHPPHHQPGGIRGQPVVAVHKLKIRARRPANSQIPAVGDPGIFLVNHSHSGILLPVSAADFPGPVRTPVIYQNQLQILIVLIQNAVHTAFQIFLCVKNRYNHRDRRFHYAAYLLSVIGNFFYPITKRGTTPQKKKRTFRPLNLLPCRSGHG